VSNFDFLAENKFSVSSDIDFAKDSMRNKPISVSQRTNEDNKKDEYDEPIQLNLDPPKRDKN